MNVQQGRFAHNGLNLLSELEPGWQLEQLVMKTRRMYNKECTVNTRHAADAECLLNKLRLKWHVSKPRQDGRPTSFHLVICNNGSARCIRWFHKSLTYACAAFMNPNAIKWLICLWIITNQQRGIWFETILNNIYQDYETYSDVN